MNKEERNLNLLAIFHYIVGAFVVLSSTFSLIWAGAEIVEGYRKHDVKNSPSPGFLEWLPFLLAYLGLFLALILGILIIIAGRKLKRHKARTFCLVIAGIECILTPFGTVLGVFTIITLMKESVLQLFANS